MYKYRVKENKLLTPTIRSLKLVAKNSAILFEPGQYLAMSMQQKGRPTTTRCFSIASSPIHRKHIEICVRVKGKYTTAMANLNHGDLVTIRGPFGRFIFEEYKHKQLVLFAGGIGITPFMSMIRYANDLKLTNRIHLIYSCRNQNDIPFLEELLEIKKNNSNLDITFFISSGAATTLKEVNIVLGHINQTNLSMLNLNTALETYMICGPASYIKSLNSSISGLGVPNERILSEAFSQGKHTPSDNMTRWPHNMYALAGVLFALIVLFITGNDLLKTLPKLKEEYKILSSETKKFNNIANVPPQINTDISQKPIIKYTQPQNPTIIQNPTPAPVLITPQSKPIINPTTKTPVTRPRTRVS